MRRLHISFIFGTSLLLIAVLAVILVAQPDAPPQETVAPQQTTAPHFWNDPAIRTIVVADSTQQLTRKGDVLLTELVAGTLPSDARTAKVLTDSNCAPDQNGVSHCLNELEIGATKVTVQHHHDMRSVLCLSPGETVTVLNPALFQKLPAS